MYWSPQELANSCLDLGPDSTHSLEWSVLQEGLCRAMSEHKKGRGTQPARHSVQTPGAPCTAGEATRGCPLVPTWAPHTGAQASAACPRAPGAGESATCLGSMRVGFNRAQSCPSVQGRHQVSDPLEQGPHGVLRRHREGQCPQPEPRGFSPKSAACWASPGAMWGHPVTHIGTSTLVCLSL